MGQPTADDDEEGGMRQERVSPAPKGRVRDALHVAVEIPVKFVIGILIVGAFNGGVVWVQFGALVKSTETLQTSHQALNTTITKIEETNLHQNEKLADHENRLRTVERTKP